MSAYDLLLHLYPVSFRREYGEEMRAVFARQRQAAIGLPATTALWVRALDDVVTSAAAVHGDILAQDLRYTWRTLLHSRGFALTAILVTALGVGANTAAFSVADFVLIRPLPFANPDRLVRVWEAPAGGELEASAPNYRDWLAMNRSFQAMGAFHSTALNLVGVGEPLRLTGAAMTPGLFTLLGVRPALGRLFAEPDQHGEAAGPIIISYGLWQGTFAGDSTVIGRTVLMDDFKRQIVGVMPSGFNFPSRDATIWTAMPVSEEQGTDRTDNWLEVVARLRPGVTIEQARADMSVVAAQLARLYPKENDKVGAHVNTLREEMSRQSVLLLEALCGAALCVLLIACANLASLLLARGLARRRELDVRAALGAGRERLARQLLTESIVLATAGGVVGVALGAVALPLLARLVPFSLPVAQAPTIDARVLAFAALLTAVTGVGFGVVPALRASSASLDALREGARAGGGRRARLRSALVVAEVVASVVLLVSAGLLMRALDRVLSTDPGFRTDGVLSLRTEPPRPRYDSVAARQLFYTKVLESVRALPGVESAAYISGLPMNFTGGIWPVSLDGQLVQRTPGRTASLRYVTPGYFRTLGIRLERGRDVAETDEQKRPFVAVVSESFARKYWPGEDAIGKRFQFALSERTVVGVAGDVRVRGLERTSEPQVYVPSAQVADRSIMGYIPQDLVIRSSVPPVTLAASARRIVHEVDREMPVSSVRTLDAVVAGTTTARAVQVRVLGAFALVAFLLAAVGIHGVLAFSVAQRKHEFGVRMALGAQPAQIVGMVLRQGALLAAAGVVPGTLLAWAAARGLESLLAGVKPSDPATYVAAAGICAVMTLAGSLAPVRRAVRVAPAAVFRGE
ncbi:MAG: ABC transporter permease [Gemmatimonadales bacterium]